jgi:hypothetical protein
MPPTHQTGLIPQARRARITTPTHNTGLVAQAPFVIKGILRVFAVRHAVPPFVPFRR